MTVREFTFDECRGFRSHGNCPKVHVVPRLGLLGTCDCPCHTWDGWLPPGIDWDGDMPRAGAPLLAPKINEKVR